MDKAKDLSAGKSNTPSPRLSRGASKTGHFCSSIATSYNGLQWEERLQIATSHSGFK